MSPRRELEGERVAMVERMIVAPVVGVFRPLGVETGNSVAGTTGALVSSVVAGGPAEAAGLLSNDVILQIDGKDILSSEDVSMAINDAHVGQTISIKVRRGGAFSSKDVPTSPLRNDQHEYNGPRNIFNSAGFRCAKSLP